MKQKLIDDDIVLCTVKRIEGTTVFLDIEENGQGSMIFSEVSPGRIRNIRKYIVVNKKIVCKVLRIKGEHIELSLRRVTAKEREEVLDKHKKEKIFRNILKPILKENTEKTIDKIKEKYDLANFLDETRENPEIIKKYIPSAHSNEIAKILSEKKEKEREVVGKISIKSISPNGLLDIKKTLITDKAEIRYLGSSNFSIKVKAKSYKEAKLDLEEVIDKIKEKAKNLKIKIELK